MNSISGMMTSKESIGKGGGRKNLDCISEMSALKHIQCF